MEFKFNINEVFKQPVVEINQNLIPPGFGGDRRALWDTVNKVTEVVNAIGEASATAQGLTKPITTAERLRNSEHKLYLLIDQNANNGKGAVTGMLKTGSKGLYVFDREGQHYQVSPSCVLDFYIHESRQRTGLGKQLFEHMLEKEQIAPVQMAIDRPSDKFLGFLNKHYALNSPVKQMNNYVVFDGFFPKQSEDVHNVDTMKSVTPVKKDSANGLQTYTSPIGRYGAHRPPCSMGQIIHNQTSTLNKRQEPAGVQSLPATNYQGIQNSPQQPNPYITQSVPNIQYGAPNGNYYPNPQYVSQEGRIQGQPELNELQLSLQNQMRIDSQQNIAQNFNQTQVGNFSNPPHQPMPGVSGYPTQNNPHSTNLNNNYSQQMMQPNSVEVARPTANVPQNYQNYNVAPQHVPQVNPMNEGINTPQNLNTDQIQNLQSTMNAAQHVHQTSQQPNFSAHVQSQQIPEKLLQNEYHLNQTQNQGNYQNQNSSVSAYQQPVNVQQMSNVQQTPNVQQIPNVQQMPNVQQTPNIPQLSNVQQMPNFQQTPYIQQQNNVASNMVYQPTEASAITPHSTLPPQPDAQQNASQSYIHQQQMANNPPRALDGSTPIAQHPQLNPNQQTATTGILNELPPQSMNQNQVQPSSPTLNQLQGNPSVPTLNPNQNNIQQPVSPAYMNGGPALNQMPSQQMLNQNQIQQNASMLAVNSNQPSTPPTSVQTTNLPVPTQNTPYNIYQTRHPPLPLGQQRHQSVMNLQQRDQNIWNDGNMRVGHAGDYNTNEVPQNAADAQSGVNQSYSVPNVYGNYQNSPQNVRREDSVQYRASQGDSRNINNNKEVTEEGVLKYGYPVQMTKSQVFAQANIVRQQAS